MFKTFLFLTALGLSQGATLRNTQSVCPSSGYTLIPHEYDCTKFYFCVDGVRDSSPTSCKGSKNHFSVEIGKCVNYKKAGCTLLGHPTETEVTTEVPNQEIEIQTQAPVQPNELSAVIEIAPIPTTKESREDFLANEAELPSEILISNQQSIVIDTAPAPESSSEESCEDFLENGCPIDFDLQFLLPHETSCRKFYYCVHGEKVLTKCSPGTVFNPDKQVCVHPGSIDRTCEVEDSTEEDIDDENTEESTQESSEEIERLPNGCPVDWNISTYLPHNTDCDKYYQCNFGQLVERPCAPGTHFNPALQVCDHPWNVNCTLSGSNDTSKELSNDTSEAVTTPKPSNFHENGCPVDGLITWLLPHKDDCTKFYSCVWGSLVTMDCPTNLHFSFELQRCENPAIAGCITTCSSSGGSCGNGNDNNNDSDNGNNNNNDSNNGNGNDSNDDNNNGSDNNNNNDSASGNDSSNDNGSSSVNDTDNDDTTKPPSDFHENGCPVDGMITWLLPHKDDCGKFYSCVWGSLVTMDCPANLHFSFEHQRCENPAIAGCITPCSNTGGSCGNDNDSGDDSDNGNNNDNDNDNDNGNDNDNNNDDDNGNDTNNDNDSGNGNDNNNNNGNDNDNNNDNGNDNDNNNDNGNDNDNNNDNGNDNDNNNENDNGNDNNNDNDSGNGNENNNDNGNDNDNNNENDNGNDNDNDNDDNNDNDNDDNDDDSNNDNDDSDSVSICPEDANEDPQDKKCKEECNALPWAHEDCDKYWSCNGQKAKLIVCSEGLHFNPSTYTCDFICNASCVRHLIQTTSGQDGLRVFLPWNQINEDTRSLLKIISH